MELEIETMADLQQRLKAAGIRVGLLPHEQFIDTCCEIRYYGPRQNPEGENATVSEADFVHAYLAWCKERGHKPISARAMRRHFEACCFTPVETPNGAGWRGLGLLDKERWQ